MCGTKSGKAIENTLLESNRGAEVGKLNDFSN